MSSYNADECTGAILEMSRKEKFSEIFSELERCDGNAQKQKIQETNEIVDGMNHEEFNSIFTRELFNKIEKMIEEKKISMENTILLLKCIIYYTTLKRVDVSDFERSSLNERFKKMIIEEEKKNEGKNEKLLTDLCECYFFLTYDFTSEMLSICVPCLLKVALHKEESEKDQKDVEMALLALREIGFFEMKQELYLKEITEIIEHQQKHRNLTKLAYQCAWLFLIFRFWDDNSLEEVIVNELHFVGEAARELEELTRNVNWKKKEEEMNKEEAKEEFALMRWVETLRIYFFLCSLCNEENVELINSIVQVYRAAKGNNGVISNQCISPLRNAAEYGVVKVKDLLKSGAIDAILEEIHQPTLDDRMLFECLLFFLNISERLKEKEDGETTETKRKELKRKIFEKMEEEGYEDTIACFHKIFGFLYNKFFRELSLKISDYFVNI
ncbi:uncharacterized protein MONOS_18161 [Monocercomonoides exilis]|uniref:uncharacterized protein n=1 Tax=Monocercomonoides exilis TaxID=2049356 RepID=UPI00355AC705|nr:hypothetical protein MONOS_18161 [Monocercomonoides exilis]